MLHTRRVRSEPLNNRWDMEEKKEKRKEYKDELKELYESVDKN